MVGLSEYAMGCVKMATIGGKLGHVTQLTQNERKICYKSKTTQDRLKGRTDKLEVGISENTILLVTVVIATVETRHVTP